MSGVRPSEFRVGFGDLPGAKYPKPSIAAVAPEWPRTGTPLETSVCTGETAEIEHGNPGMELSPPAGPSGPLPAHPVRGPPRRTPAQWRLPHYGPLSAPEPSPP